ncbi:MAG TPA: HPF/RaiA family ribosome-associated protein [Polyangiales bacterium]
MFRRQPTDDAALANIRARFAELTRLSDDIVRCHVDVDERGCVFVQLTLLRGEVVRSYDDEGKDSADVMAAIDHAFDLLALRLRGRGWSGHSARSLSFVH